MSYTYGPSFRDQQVLALHVLVSQIHHTLGVLVLVAGCCWIVVRLRSARPPFPAALPRSERVLTRSVHAILLLLLVLIPWSGWTALSALQDSAAYGVTHRWFFGFDALPRIWQSLDALDPRGYSRFARLHRSFLWAGAALLTVHVAAALWHHGVRRDGVLARMWPLGSQ